MSASDRHGFSLASAVTTWLEAFESALQQHDAAHDAALALSLFIDDSHWRDLLAITWQIQTVNGRAAIARTLLEPPAAQESPVAQEPRVAARAKNFRLAPGRTPPRQVTRAGTDTIEALYVFETEHGKGNGVVRLVADASGPGGVRAWILVTALDSITGQSECNGAQQSDRNDYSRDFGGDNWLDKRNKARAYADHDPAVLVVGAGQAGLAIGARLSHLGIDTLIIDRQQQLGDNWRKRYHSLTLHNEVHVNHMPYLPFPASWPVFIPKDKLANWFEFYADALDLNCWMGSELVGGSYDQQTAHWRVTVRQSDGGQRVMRPRHIIFATGVSSIAQSPRLLGLEIFAGTVLHSGHYTEGSAWRGRKVMVLGTGNSGHDVAQDLQASGAQVTLIQRSPTYIVSIQEAQRVYALYGEGLPTDDCDLIATAIPYPVLERSYQMATEMSSKADQPLIDGLKQRGFRIDEGPGHTGFQMLYLRRGGGYYFNVGCSDLIVDGRIDLLQFDQIERFVRQGVQLKDGTVREAELLVTATGYKNQQDVVRMILGDAVADRVGPVWGFNEGGEMRNMWRPTGQPGLWFTAGSLAQCRIYSKYLALQIKAHEIGLLKT